MNKLDLFIAEAKKQSQIADDVSNTPSVRIVALCKLYSLFEYNVSEQAVLVSRIKEIAEHCIENDR